jgi:MFS family permease
MPSAWFPAEERATAIGAVTLANIVGTALGLILSPLLLAPAGIAGTQLIYGGSMALAAFLFLAFARERPPLPPDESASRERALVLEGLRGALGKPSFRRYLLLAFLGMGVFNGVTTWIEGIARSRGIGSGEAGLLGAIMLGGGVVGALLLPSLSDKAGRRRPFIVLGFAGAVPGLVGLALAPNFALLALASLVLGFFLVAASPIGMQYAAEEARPAPEGASNGLVTLAGQVAVVLVWAMEALARAAGSFGPVLWALAGALALASFLAAGLEEKTGA